MATLHDWKTALASGVKIETLLGLEKDADQQAKGRSDQATGANQPKNNSEHLDLSVRTGGGQILEFQWSSPSLATISPNCDNHIADETSAAASTMIVSPPSIPVNQILGPCFIDISNQPDGQDNQSGVANANGKKPPPSAAD